ncbi:MAG: glycosyltransferase [Anaerolineae bacterium]|nr:glycosyltransferase [Thermoflexales bacterium]MDW8408278.1 glycosyltransferase [Anaerolineae bacterium]
MPRRIVIVCSGTRGDVQPHVALGARLHQGGAQVSIATHLNFRKLVEARGLSFAPLADNPNELLVHPAYHGALTPSAGLLRSAWATLRFWRAARAAFACMVHDAWQACQTADTIVAALPTWWAAFIAEALRLPFVFASLQPLAPTADFPSPMLPLAPAAGPTFNRLTYALVEQLVWLPWRAILNRWRSRELGLPALRRARVWRDWAGRPWPCVYGFSAVVVPRPLDWPPNHHISGYWFDASTSTGQLSTDLARFLEIGDPPIYIGFGSYPWRLAPVRLHTLIQALALAGLRAVVLVDDHTRQTLRWPASIYPLTYAPHDALFPRVSLVVHHGGAGTVAAALRAGAPQLIAPIAVDQFFWGARVEALGVGRSLRRGPFASPVDADSLARVLQEMTCHQELRRRAAHIQRTVLAEDGVGRAVEWIQAGETARIRR